MNEEGGHVDTYQKVSLKESFLLGLLYSEERNLRTAWEKANALVSRISFLLERIFLNLWDKKKKEKRKKRRKINCSYLKVKPKCL